MTAGMAVDTDLVGAWRELLERHARTTSALERRLQELADAVHLSQSALSSVVARLETDGLVSRGMCPEDRRGIMACLTDSGRERYEAARPTHRTVLAETLTA